VEEDRFENIPVFFDAVGSEKHCSGIGCPSIEWRGKNWYCHAFESDLVSTEKWIIKRCKKCLRSEKEFYELYDRASR
jgi:hypothetical protein